MQNHRRTARNQDRLCRIFGGSRTTIESGSQWDAGRCAPSAVVVVMMRALPRAQAVARDQGPERLSDLAMTGWVSRSAAAIDQVRRASQ